MAYVVLFRGKVYVLLDAQLWHDIIEAHHNILVTGHSGIRMVEDN